jgi:hypothetical protein
MSDLILREFNGKSIRHRVDGFMSLTDMCATHGKLFGNWNKTKEAKEYLKVLQSLRYSDQNNGPIEVNQGGTPSGQGTWGDRRVAMRLAQWLSPEFAIQVDEWIVELMERGTISVAQPARQLAPQRDLYDYMEIAKVMGLQESPILKSLFEQRMAEQLGGSGLSSTDAPKQILLTVRASELGISSREIGTGSQLGKYIRSLGFAPVGKSQHGKYPVNVYGCSIDLDKAILGFFSDVELENEAA